MDFFLVFSKVLVIFMLIVIGYWTVKTELVTPKGHQDLTNLLLYIFLPCTLIRTFQIPFERSVFGDALMIFLMMCGIYLAATLLAITISRRIASDTQKQAVLVLGMVLPNVSFMGYPIIEAILGSEYIFYAVMGNIAFEIISWSIMVNLLVKSTGIRTDKNFVQRLASTPAIISIALGLTIYLSPWRIPETIFSTVNLLGNAMTPVAMLIVGMSLAKADLKKVFFQKELYLVSFIRLVVIPLLVIAALRFFAVDGILLSIPIILISMPSAGYTSILAGKFGADPTFAAEIVTICTLLSLVSIPLVLTLL